MPRPKGHALNRDAFDDLLTVNRTSLSKLAEGAGMPRSTLSGLAAGFQRASVPMANRVATALGCSVGTLFPTLSRDRVAFKDGDA